MYHRELIQWANTTKLLKYLTPQCNTTLNYFISTAFQSDFEVFSCILLNSVLKYMLNCMLTIRCSYSHSKSTLRLKMRNEKKHGDARIKIACLLLKDWTVILCLAWSQDFICMHSRLVTKYLQISDLKYKIRVHHERKDWSQNNSTVPNKSLYNVISNIIWNCSKPFHH